MLIFSLVPGVRGLVWQVPKCPGFLCCEVLTGSSCCVCRGVVDKDKINNYFFDYNGAFHCKSCGWGFLGVNVVGGSGG